jgi:uncharacterized membrane protein YcaP (DUF421 family)
MVEILPRLFFDGESSLVRVVLVGIAAYIGLIIYIRVASKRTAAKLTTTYDFVVSVAFGTLLATTIVDPNVSLVEKLLALLVLIVLQAGAYWIMFPKVQWLVISPPEVLLFNGKFVHRRMKRCRITKQEIFGAMRLKGLDCCDNIAAVIMESNGNLSILQNVQDINSKLFENVIGWPPKEEELVSTDDPRLKNEGP